MQPATPREVQAVTRGIELLKEARELFKLAGASNTTDRIRAALISADGAKRHVRHRELRTRTNTL